MRASPAAALAAGLLAAAAAGCGNGRYAGQAMQPARSAPDIALYGADSTVVSFARPGGQASLVTFGYTSCPDVCPTTLSGWREVREALGPDTAHVRFVFVSGDWRHDTPARTAQFARQFHPAFVGVTADSTTIRRLLPRFQAQVGYGSAAGSRQVGFAHTDYHYIVDPSGRIVRWFPFRSRARDIANDLRLVVRSRERERE